MEAREVQAAYKENSLAHEAGPTLPVRLWGRLPERLGSLQPQGPFSSQQGKALSSLVWALSWPCFDQEVGLETSRGNFQTKLFCDCTISSEHWIRFSVKDLHWLCALVLPKAPMFQHVTPGKKSWCTSQVTLDLQCGCCFCELCLIQLLSVHMHWTREQVTNSRSKTPDNTVLDRINREFNLPLTPAPLPSLYRVFSEVALNPSQESCSMLLLRWNIIKCLNSHCGEKQERSLERKKKKK